MSIEKHRSQAPRFTDCSILTISDSRTKEDDKSGAWLQQALLSAGHQIIHYRLIPDDIAQIRFEIDRIASDRKTRVLLLNGGTGIARRDCTYEAVNGMLEKQMPGFGELFRYLSFTEEIGSAAILSRATAGIYQQMAIFSMPGSTKAVQLAMTRLILPEIGHLIGELDKEG
ncbi:MogA/MoaB family molybdenum cofactor biosynthesis protein [Marinicrinis sediminis]|uniref:Molybdenum cofactor biosynthesis protein B n=1 Tax=Marinicrinis sediminis TaxID=1652465 RepID=A0ABW5R6G7_9BACL